LCHARILAGQREDGPAHGAGGGEGGGRIYAAVMRIGRGNANGQPDAGAELPPPLQPDD